MGTRLVNPFISYTAMIHRNKIFILLFLIPCFISCTKQVPLQSNGHLTIGDVYVETYLEVEDFFRIGCYWWDPLKNMDGDINGPLVIFEVDYKKPLINGVISLNGQNRLFTFEIEPMMRVVVDGVQHITRRYSYDNNNISIDLINAADNNDFTEIRSNISLQWGDSSKIIEAHGRCDWDI